MTSIENYKRRMSPGLRTFFEDYEIHIKQLFSDLNDRGFLGTSFEAEDSERLADINRTFHGVHSLGSDFNKMLMIDDEEKIRENLRKLGEIGWNAEEHRIFLQYGIILSLTYHASLERLKNYFLTFINWENLNVDTDKVHGLGGYLSKLKDCFPGNPYLNYFDSGTRNSIAHFTFFWKNGKIYFCKNLKDNSPTNMTLGDFIMEIQHVNSLVEAFPLIFMDFLGMPPTDNFVN